MRSTRFVKASPGVVLEADGRHCRAEHEAFGVASDDG